MRYVKRSFPASDTDITPTFSECPVCVCFPVSRKAVYEGMTYFVPVS